MRRIWTALVAALLVIGPAAVASPFPESVPLPTGYQPEGVDTRGSVAYAGSLVDGDVVTVDLRSGEVSHLVDNEPSQGRVAVGLAVERGLVLVAGGGTGHAFAYDARTGEDVAEVELTDSTTTFVNDVVVAGDSAWFTDSFQAQLYRVPLRSGGVGQPETVPLSGPAADLPGLFNLNGIEARDGRLIVVNSTSGELFAVSPDGQSRSIDLGGDAVTAGDGILLSGRWLYVVRNQLNQVDVVELSGGLTSGEVVDTISSDLFDVPTTVARHGNRLVLVNARFGIEEPSNAEYDLVQVRR
ncbi:MAG: PQQ-binding-like beta-propeller repeat protein [Actinomycetota bacterium]